MTEKRQPWFKFHTADWRGDAGLRLVGAAARGLWIDMLTIMHEATPYGHLAVGVNQLDYVKLASCVGMDPEEVRVLLDRLEQNNVFSRTEQGVIYSRRMVNDQKKALRDKENGRSGGNPLLKGAPAPKHARVRGGVNPPVKQSLKAKSPESRVQKKGSPNGLPASEQTSLPTLAALPLQDTPTRARQAALEDAAVRLFNNVAQSSGLSRCVSLSKTRRAEMRHRLNDYGLEGWQKALAAVEASDHWQGRTTGWRGCFDDFVNERKFLKLIEGGYATATTQPGGRTSRPNPNADLLTKYGFAQREPESGVILDMEDV